MAVAMTNAKITELDWDHVMQTSRGQVVPVCKATDGGIAACWNGLLGELAHAQSGGGLQGDESGQLDWKANEWATFPGVEYVLCVALGKGLTNASYKLYRVEHRSGRLPVQAPRPVASPNSNLQFDSRLLLRLQPDDALPTQFPDAGR